MLYTSCMLQTRVNKERGVSHDTKCTQANVRQNHLYQAFQVTSNKAYQESLKKTALPYHTILSNQNSGKSG